MEENDDLPMSRDIAGPSDVDQHKKLLETRENDENNENPGLRREHLSLLIIVLVALGNQWQRFLIGYANGLGISKKDETTEIAWEYRDYNWQDIFGVLAGPAFTITFAIMGIFGGVTSDNANRKLIIIVCSIGWNTCTLLSGLIKNFWIFFLLRILMGLFQAFMNPTAYSIIADYYPPQMRTRANSVFNLAIYFGGAMASVSGIIINAIGWRNCYTIVSFFGYGTSVLFIFLVKDPPRGRWAPKKDPSTEQTSATTVQKKSTIAKFLSALKEIVTNPTCRYVALGGFMRFYGGFTIGYYLPVYFNLIWGNEYTSAYSISNAFVVSIFGLCSALIGGYAGDIFENKGIAMTKAYICIFSAISGGLFFALCTLIQIKSEGGFILSICMLALEYLCAENWIAPAITMMMTTISQENKAFGVGAFLFVCSIGGTIGPVITQAWFNSADVKENHGSSGHILCVQVLISYIGSIPFFYLAGKSYCQVKAEQDKKE